jgi:hypothetical protein
VNTGYVVGGLACLALLALAILGAWRARRAIGERAATARVAAAAPPTGESAALAGAPPLDDPPAMRWPLRRALAAGLAAAAIGGFVFALRAGIFIGPAVALLLWRGASTRFLVLAAGGLLVVVLPAVYLLFPAEDRGGYNTEYAQDLLGAHWVVVAAFVLLTLALARLPSSRPRARPDPAGAPPGG